MTTQAALYLNPWLENDPDDLTGVAAPAVRRARLVACRLYAAGRGYRIAGVHAAVDAPPHRRREAAAGLLDWAQRNAFTPDSALPVLPDKDRPDKDLPDKDRPNKDLPVIVVYDAGELVGRDGRPDAIGRLVAALGVRVETVLPPHTAEEINGYFAPEAVQLASRTVRNLLGTPGDPAPSLGDEPGIRGGGEEEAEADDADRPLETELYEELLDLLGDTGRLRTILGGQRDGGARQARWAEAHAGICRAEADAQRRRRKLLDLWLENLIDKPLLLHRRVQADAQLAALRQERRLAQAHLTACTLTPAQETLVLEVCRQLQGVLARLDPSGRRRVARYLDLHAVMEADGRERASCLLPIGDEPDEPEETLEHAPSAQPGAGRHGSHRRAASAAAGATAAADAADDLWETNWPSDYPLVWERKSRPAGGAV
jgi:hypothetical protein